MEPNTHIDYTTWEIGAVRNGRAVGVCSKCKRNGLKTPESFLEGHSSTLFVHSAIAVHGTVDRITDSCVFRESYTEGSNDEKN